MSTTDNNTTVAAVVVDTAATSEATSGLVLHHLEHSRSQRVIWMLEEIGAPYKIKVYKRTATRQAPPELQAVNPLGKAPAITDDGGVTVSESAAILEYILEKYGNGHCLPPPAGKLDDRYFTHYSEGSLMPLLVMRLVTGLIPPRVPFFVRPIARGIVGALDSNYTSPELKKHIEMIEAHLVKSPTGWFAGGDEPTLADFMMSMPLEAIAATTHGTTETLGPATSAFVKKVQARPAYLRALEKGEVGYHYGPANSKL